VVKKSRESPLSFRRKEARPIQGQRTTRCLPVFFSANRKMIYRDAFSSTSRSGEI